MKQIVKTILSKCGYDIVRHTKVGTPDRLLPDLTEEEQEICMAVAPFTMTSVERIVALIHATKYVTEMISKEILWSAVYGAAAV